MKKAEMGDYPSGTRQIAFFPRFSPLGREREKGCTWIRQHERHPSALAALFRRLGIEGFDQIIQGAFAKFLPTKLEIQSRREVKWYRVPFMRASCARFS